ncbi:MAG: hypothetical protein WDA16_02910 [Candidatus Thermoplasmatota archaeon]
MMLRAAPFLTLVVLLLTPLAAPQPSATGTPKLEMGQFPDAVHPLQAPVKTGFALTMSCLSDTPGRAAHAVVWVAEKPTWATATVSPGDFAAPEGCTAPTTQLSGELVVTANDQAPAGRPGRITLMAAQVDPTGNHTTSAMVNVTASYFSIIDTQLAETIKIVKPGGTVTFPLKLTNFGNDRTRVNFSVGDVGEGLTVGPLPDIMLGSKQQGDSNISQDVPIVVTAAGGVGYLNRVGVINVNSASFSAVDGTVGDSSQHSFVVTTKGLDAPLGFAAPLVALTLAALSHGRSSKKP